MLMLFFPNGSKIAAATPGLSATPTRVIFASFFEYALAYFYDAHTS